MYIHGDDAQWFQMAETRQKKFTYSDFMSFSNQVSANSLDFRFRSMQVLYIQNIAAIGITSQFHEFFNLILGGFSSFENTV